VNMSSWFDSLFHDTASQQEMVANTPAVTTEDAYIPAPPAVAEPETASSVPVEQPTTNNSSLDVYGYYDAFAEHYQAARPILYFPVKPEVETPQESEPTPTTAAIIPASELETTHTAAEKGYFVIGGMFCKERNARRFLKLLTEKGYSDAQLLPSKAENCQRVSYKKFANKRDAENFCSTIQTETNPEAWVLEVF
jgi:hypothetical protein